MERNVKYLKYILILSSTWFWNGIWLVYYLKLTDYAGVGLLESSMFFIGFAMEIPTGALTDMLGRKKALIIFFLLSGIGNLVMAGATSYTGLFIAVFLLVVGTAFYSGTVEALIYDTLLSLKQEEEYENYLSKVNSYQFAGLAISSVVGGFLYSVNNSLPFTITALGYMLGMLLVIALVTEPKIDSEKFSLRDYLQQNFGGFKVLFANKNIGLLVFAFVSIVGLKHMFTNLLDNSFAIEIGYSPLALGILFSVLPLVSSISSHGYKWLKSKLGTNFIFYALGCVFFISAILSFQLNFLIIGTIILVFRAFYDPLIDVYVSQKLNAYTPSKTRATVISTFTMLKALPYIALAYFMGDFSDAYAPSLVISVISAVFFIIFMITLWARRFVMRPAAMHAQD